MTKRPRILQSRVEHTIRQFEVYSYLYMRSYRGTSSNLGLERLAGAFARLALSESWLRSTSSLSELPERLFSILTERGEVVDGPASVTARFSRETDVEATGGPLSRT